MAINLSKITKKGRAMFLAYDQGIEHGPIEFNDKNVDPNYIIDIAKKGNFTALIFQKGISEKYQREIKKSKVPLIVKLNGKTSLYKGEPISRQLCTVKEASSLGAKAVGYTIYVGSEKENIMLQEFEKIEKEAHQKKIPVIAWIYPRGKSVEKENKTYLMAYAARVALEIGADIVKIHREGSIEDMKWAVKSAGKTKVVFSGGAQEEEKDFLKKAKEALSSGAIGLAVGRNIWQAKNPLQTAKKLQEIIWSR